MTYKPAQHILWNVNFDCHQYEISDDNDETNAHN